jgi:hypothetical protein
MRTKRTFIVALFAWGLGAMSASADDAETARLAELDAYWTEVSRTVREGDFEGYRATCHPEAVLVSGKSKTSYPLTEALARWEAEFDATKAGTIKADVAFRFSQRFGNATTAHETGIFRYTATNANGAAKVEFIHFEALLVRRSGGWNILMEYQKSPATEAEWKALAKD